MSASNWTRGGDNRQPPSNEFNGSNNYWLDNIGLQQLGLGGLPLQVLGLDQQFSNFSCFGERRFNGNSGQSNETNSKNKPFKVEIQQTLDGIPIRKVYVTNIIAIVTRQDLFELFSQYGSIMHIDLLVSRTQNFKQISFVTFHYPEDAAKVISIHKVFSQLNGRYMYVTAADSWHQPRDCPDGTVIVNPSRHPQPRLEDESEEEEEEAAEFPVGTVLEKDNGVNGLNDDCLMHVFSFLSYKELAGVERVCKRWQALSFRMWKCLHKLNFKTAPFNRTKMTTLILEQHLKRCGESLTSLELTGKMNSFNEATIAIIAKYCVNLEVLRVASINMGNRSMAHLGHRCSKLKELVLYNCSKFGDADLMSLLPKCRQLEHLDISSSFDVYGKCLASVEGPINTLRLHNCTSIRPSNLIAGLHKMSSTLQNLVISGGGHCEDVNKVIATVPNLTSLSLSFFFSHFQIEAPTAIGQLNKLTKLDLSSNNAINDKVITAIVDGCEDLTSLNLSGSEGSCNGCLTEMGLSMLGRLRKLIHLDLSFMDIATNTVLTNITTRNPRLKQIVCRGCTELNDEGCSHVVSMCNELELFDISGCSIGEGTVKSALTSVKMRTNNVPLRLILGGTKFVSGELPEGLEPSPLLTLDMADLSDTPNNVMNHLFFPHDSDSDDEDVDLDNLCCDCEFEFYDDCVDPTLFPSDFEDDSPKFGGYDEDDDDWVEDDDEDEENEMLVYKLKD